MTERILVVEDSPAQAQYVRLLLEDEGYAVDVAANGEMGLRLARALQPDMIISDVVMPEMDGHTFCRALKSDPETHAIPLVMLTVLGAEQDRALALENGADDFLNKPVDPDELVARIRSVLRVKTVPHDIVDSRTEPACVLLVVDDQARGAIVRSLLEDAGYLVEPVSDTSEALARARQTPPDLVLCPAEGPDFDGYTLCRSLKSTPATHRIPIGVLTSAAVPTQRTKALEAGADDVISAPVDRAELLARVRSLQRMNFLYEQLAERDDEVAHQSEELARKNAELMQLMAELEERVAARTAELEAKNEELRSMSQQLWQTAKLATMGELAASVAHELNNPLATIGLRIESMLAGRGPDDPERRSLGIIEGELDRMARLVARLLEFSRFGEQQRSTVDLPNEVGNALELVHNYMRNRRVSVETDFGPSGLAVHADRQQIRQILLNLFTNAADAMPDGGTLTIRIRREEARGTDRSNGGAHPQVVMEVSDTGMGIAPDDVPRVLEPFFTTKAEGRGTGLGLAICRRLVQEHHGTLEIASELGQGTTVRVTLPAVNSGANHYQEREVA